jgi:hypothetical protein
MNGKPLTDEASDAFQRYCELKQIVEADPTVENAVACGKAWAEFLDIFTAGKPSLTVIDGGLRQ